MREMKDSGIEWVGKIPKHWFVMHNKYIMTKKKTIKEIYGGEDIISLSTNGVIVRDLDAGGKMPKTFDGYQIVHPGNLLMCLFDYDVTPRCIGLIKNFGVTSPAYSQFVMSKNNHPGYYNYYYLMVDHTKAILHLAKNLRHSFTEEQLGSISAPVPPIEEQVAIEKFLDQKCSEIDAISSDIQKQISVLEDYKKSVITEAVTKGLNPDVEMKDSGIDWIGKIPKCWKFSKIKYVVKEYSVNSFMNPDEDSYLGLENVIGYSSSIVLTKTEYTKSIQKKCKKGHLLFSKLRPYLAKVLICPFDGFCTSEFLELDSFEGDVRFLYYFMLNSKFIDVVDLSTYGAKMPRANSEFIMGLNIAYPNKNEQKQLADYLDKKCSEIDAIVYEKKKQIEILAEYKKSLIYEYVTGKKEVPEN